MNTWPHFAQDEIDAVTEVLQSGKVNYWTGDQCKNFESAFAAYIGVSYGVALANGTLALEAALYAIDIQPGDEVIVPCRTFLATASAVVARGGTPIIADVELGTQNISVSTIRPWVSAKTKAIIVVHLAGYPCDMDPILTFAKEKNIRVIEDCAQAHGAIYKGQKVGSLGDIGVFSFCQDKIMTTGGEGGFLGTSDKTLWKKVWQYKDHGKDPDLCNQPGDGNYRWLHTQFGSNWRLTEMQSAIGIKQLEKLESWIEKRTQNAQILAQVFEKYPQFSLPKLDLPNSRHSFYKFYVRLLSGGPALRNTLITRITEAGIPCMVGSCFNISYEKAFQAFPTEFEKKLPNAKILGETSFLLQVHPTISTADMQSVARKVDAILLEGVL